VVEGLAVVVEVVVEVVVDVVVVDVDVGSEVDELTVDVDDALDWPVVVAVVLVLCCVLVEGVLVAELVEGVLVDEGPAVVLLAHLVVS
jgi:hypothetical protein